MAGDCSDMVTYASVNCAGTNTPCVELRGPSAELASVSAAVIISAPHGGSLKPVAYADRDCEGNAGWICAADSYTLELSERVATRFGMQHNGRCPWMVINYLHRSKLDANREIVEAADGDANAEIIWQTFHDYIALAQEKVQAIHGDDGSGIKGVLFDFHGYKGTDYNPAGSPYTQYGYRLTENTLDVNQLPDSPSGSMTHASQSLGAGGLERVVRGDKSMGHFVPAIDQQLVVGDMPAGCGDPMPSPMLPNPKAICANCDYKSGGYDIREHENNVVGNLKMNAIQIELPRCIRRADYWYNGVAANDAEAVWDDFADKVSIGLCLWLDGIFPNSDLC